VRSDLAGARDVLAVIAAGGAAGSLARWGVAQALPTGESGFASATLAANLSGSLLLGGLLVLVLEVWPPSRYVRPFLGVGLLGGYTTFSSAMLDAQFMIAAGRPGLAAGYLAASVVGSVVAAWLGATAVRAGLAARAHRIPAGPGPDPHHPDDQPNGKPNEEGG
jgi:CrcB protein